MVKPVATDTSAELAVKSVPAVTVTARRTGPLLDSSGSPVLASVDATLTPLVMLPAEVIICPFTTIFEALADYPQPGSLLLNLAHHY